MDIKDKSPIETFLEERESVGEHLINVRQFAMDRADEKFKKEYESVYKHEELYMRQDEEHRPHDWTLKDEFNDIFWGMVDEFEEELLEYKNEEYG